MSDSGEFLPSLRNSFTSQGNSTSKVSFIVSHGDGDGCKVDELSVYVHHRRHDLSCLICYQGSRVFEDNTLSRYLISSRKSEQIIVNSPKERERESSMVVSSGDSTVISSWVSLPGSR